MFCFGHLFNYKQFSIFFIEFSIDNWLLKFDYTKASLNYKQIFVVTHFLNRNHVTVAHPKNSFVFLGFYLKIKQGFL